MKFLQYSQAIKTHPSLVLSLLKERSISKLKEKYYFLEREQSVSKKNQTFFFNGKQYNYFYGHYFYAWATERTIEIPIFSDIVSHYKGKLILEIGNVLSHHQSIDHRVVDKYEKGEGVINADIVDFKLPTKFDLIISISTLEHVGWDEQPKDPRKIVMAIDNIRSLLSESGEFWMTIPLGYNKYLEGLLIHGGIDLSAIYFMKRISRDNSWIECPWNQVKSVRYGYPYNNANGLLIGRLTK